MNALFFSSRFVPRYALPMVLSTFQNFACSNTKKSSIKLFRKFKSQCNKKKTVKFNKYDKQGIWMLFKLIPLISAGPSSTRCQTNEKILNVSFQGF